jgi:hypothetical protein
MRVRNCVRNSVKKAEIFHAAYKVNTIDAVLSLPARVIQILNELLNLPCTTLPRQQQASKKQELSRGKLMDMVKKKHLHPVRSWPDALQIKGSSLRLSPVAFR